MEHVQSQKIRSLLPGGRTHPRLPLTCDEHTHKHTYASMLQMCSVRSFTAAAAAMFPPPLCASSVRLCAALRGDSLPITWYANAKCESVQLFTAAYILMMHKA